MNRVSGIAKRILIHFVVLVLVLSGLYGIFVDYQTAFAIASQLSTKQENYGINGDAYASVYGVNWFAQTFTPTVAHTITEVYVYVDGTGAPGSVTVDVTNTAAGAPDETDVLCTGTFDGTTPAGVWVRVSMGAGAALTASTLYAIILSVPTGDAGNYSQWRYDTAGATYAGGVYFASGDSGATWAATANRDFLFSEWGTASTGEMYYAGIPTTGNAASVLTPCSDALSSTLMVMAYRDSDTFGRAVAGTISGSHVEFASGDYTFLGAACVARSVNRLTDTTFVITYSLDATGIVYAIVGTVAADLSISYGVPVSTGLTSTGYTDVDTTVLSTTSFVVYVKAYVIAGSISGTTIAFGAAVQCRATSTVGSISEISATRFLVVYRASTTLYAKVGTLSGTPATTISLGTEYTISAAGVAVSFVDSAYLDSTHIVVTYNHYHTGISNQLLSKILVIAGAVVDTSGSEYQFGMVRDTSSQGDNRIRAFDSSNIVVSFVGTGATGGLSDYLYVTKGTVAGTVITWDDEIAVYTDEAGYYDQTRGNHMFIVPGSTTTIVSTYEDQTTGYGMARVICTQTFPPNTPVVTSVAATSITSSGARLNGTLKYDGEALCEFRFGIGTATGDYYYYAWSVGENLTDTDTFFYDAAGLDSGTTYYFIAQCSNGYFVGLGAELTFTTTGTAPEAGTEPTVTTKTAESITDVAADLKGSLDGLGSYGTVYTFFEYDVVSHAVDGPAYAYKTAEAAQTGIADLSATVTLYPGLTWYFRISCRYNTYSYIHGLEKSFNTLPDSGASTDPRVVTQAATEITTSSAVLHGVLLSLGDYTTVYTAFQYCSDGDYTDGDGSTVTTDWNSFIIGQAYLASVTELAPYTTYSFRAVGFFGYGTGSHVYGSTLTFNTGTSPLPPIPSHEVICTDANYGYYAPLIVANTSASDYTHQRVSFTTPASQLVTAMIIQSDADDVMMTELDDTTEVGLIADNLGSATATWATGLIDISADSSTQYDLWMGKATATHTQQWVSVSGDTVTTTDANSLDILNNLTVEVSFTPAVLAGTQTLLNKTGAYSLVLSVADIVGTIITGTVPKTVTVAADAVDTNQRWKMTYVSATGVKLFKYTGGAWVQQGATTAATGNIDSNINNVALMSTFTGYVDWIKVGGTDVTTPTYVLDLEFQPEDISGTAITDKSVSAQTTTYTLLANSSGVTGTLYGLVPACVNGATQYAGVTPAATDITNIPQDYFGDPDTGGKLADNPFYPFVHAIAEQTTFTETQIWRMLAGFLLIVAMLATAKYIPGHMAAVGVTQVLFCGLFCALTIFPYWAIIISVILLVGSLTMERAPVV